MVRMHGNSLFVKPHKEQWIKTEWHLCSAFWSMAYKSVMAINEWISIYLLEALLVSFGHPWSFFICTIAGKASYL
jgi:hypothetical protein